MNTLKKRGNKSVAIIVCFLLIMALSACSSTTNNKNENNKDTSTEITEKQDLVTNNTNKQSIKKDMNEKEDNKENEQIKKSSTSNSNTNTTKTRSNTTKSNDDTTKNKTTTQKNTNDTKSNTKKETDNNKIHNHKWTAVYKTIHHDEVGHYETKTVQKAYDEIIYDYVDVCNGCGKTELDFKSWDSFGEHTLFECGTGYHNAKIKVGTKHHDAVTKKVWVVDKKAYDEKVITGYKCSCGATK